MIPVGNKDERTICFGCYLECSELELRAHGIAQHALCLNCQREEVCPIGERWGEKCSLARKITPEKTQKELESIQSSLEALKTAKTSDEFHKHPAWKPLEKWLELPEPHTFSRLRILENIADLVDEMQAMGEADADIVSWVFKSIAPVTQRADQEELELIERCLQALRQAQKPADFCNPAAWKPLASWVNLPTPPAESYVIVLSHAKQKLAKRKIEEELNKSTAERVAGLFDRVLCKARQLEAHVQRVLKERQNLTPRVGN